MSRAPVLAVGCAVALLAALTSAALGVNDPDLAKIASPAPESVVVRDGGLRATVRIAPGATVSRVTLNGRRVPARVGARRNGVRVVTLGRRAGLRGGTNVIGIDTRGRSGATDFDHVRFVHADRDPSLLVLGAPKAGSSVDPAPLPAVIRSRVPVQRVRAWLNGRVVTDAFGEPDDRNRRRARLGATDGLVHGRNVLTVEVVRGNRVARTSRAFRVEGGCALVSAGDDVSVLAGQSARPRGTIRRPRGASGSARHSWTLRRAPAGSSAALVDPGSGRPTLTTDVPGRYVLELVARDPGCAGRASVGESDASQRTASAPDSVVVNAIPGVAVPVATVAQRDGAYGITLGDRFVPNPGGATPQLHVLIVDRATLEIQRSVGLAGGTDTVGALATTIEGTTNASTIILSAPPGAVLLPRCPQLSISCAIGKASRFAEAAGLFEKIGAGSFLSGFDEPINGVAGPFSLVAVPGASGAQATYSLAPADVGNGSLEGNFVVDINDNFAFSFAEYPAFATRAAPTGAGGNTIAIGDATYSAPALQQGASGGFQVVVLDGYSLAPISNQTFATNTADPSATSAAIGQMSATLRDANDNGGRVVALASIGNAAPSSFATPVDEAWTALGIEILRLGGTRDVFLRLRGSDTYSLVGLAGTNALLVPTTSNKRTHAPTTLAPGAEASPLVAPGVAPGQSGILARGTDSLFRPGVSGPGGGLNYELAEIAYQSPTPWPTPDTPGYAAANAYITQALGLSDSTTDVRANYRNSNVDWSDKALQLAGLPLPDDAGFTAAEFDALRAELEIEFAWVDQTRNYIENLQSPLTDTEINAPFQLTKVATDVTDAIKADIAKDQTTASVLDFLAAAGNTVSRLDPTLKPFGALGGGLQAVSALATSGDGAALDTVTDDAAELGVEFNDALNARIQALAVLFDVIVSDYGKLRTVGTKSTSDPDWAWDAAYTQPLASGLTDAATQTFYGSLVPVYYAAWRIDGPWTNARQATCRGGDTQAGPFVVAPWSDEPDSGQAYLAESVTPDGRVSGRIWALGHGDPRTDFFDVPTASFTDPLFENLDSGPAAVGLFAPWFFTRSFPPADWVPLSKPAFGDRTCPDVGSKP